MRIDKPRKYGFFAMLLALLGIGGCQMEEEDINGGMEVMYGVPTVAYSVKGKVTDGNGKALEGIQVTIQSRHYGNDHYWYSDIITPVASDADGKWAADRGAMPTDTIQVLFTDIDGAANGGEFATDSVRVPVKIEQDPNNTDFWNFGSARVDVPTVKLKKK